MNNKRINIVTLGCSKNVVDSEKLLTQLKAEGYDVLFNSNIRTVETVIINTCGFINDAKEESIDTILRYVSAHKEGQIKNLFVMGCLSERYMRELMLEIPEVTKYFGVNSMKDILNEMGVRLRSDLLTERTLSEPAHSAYLKISEGCNRTCAFCAIPAIRGIYISRPVEEIIKEASSLAKQNVKEIILVAQDLNYYGLDLYRRQSLSELLSELLKIESIQWIRLHYLYPADFPPELISIIGSDSKICRYIDIPIQHISDRILGLMRRSYNRREAETLLYKIREAIPGAAIRTTLIAGHPGESDKEFGELKRFISEFRFDRLGVLPYSHEEGTYSFREYTDEVPDSIKKSRVAELMEVQRAISAELNKSRIGQVYQVLIDRKEGAFFIGRTEYDSPEVDQEVLIEAGYPLEKGSFYNIRITQSTDYDLYGIPE